MKNSTPVQLKKIGQDKMQITWEDGHISVYPFRYLRQNCGCAACINELTGERTLNSESVPADLKGLGADIVGNYALHFRFSDGHETGLYPFRALREMCPCDSCNTAH
jgi:DUF971 family protein